MIVETYEEFSNNYHNGLIKENKLLKDEVDELQFSLGGMTADRDKHEEEADKRYDENKILKEKNNGYKALLLCECGVSIERVVEIKNEIKALKKENKELQEEVEELKTFKEQAEEECSASPVFEKMIDEIRNLEQKNEILEENINELKCDHLMKDDIVINLILSIIINSQSGVRYWSEWKISSNYTVAGIDDYNKNVHKYYQKVIKEMNDTDWNDDGCCCNLIYHNDYTITTAFIYSSDSD